MKLFMLLLGCKPAQRNTEQHDVFFGIANNLKELIPSIHQFWPEAENKIHLDAWREVNFVDQYEIRVCGRNEMADQPIQENKLFFLNLGGYKKNEFEEFHYKILTVCGNQSEAIRRARSSVFYKHTGFKGATSHIDDKYGVDVDDIYEIEEILPPEFKNAFRLQIIPSTSLLEDTMTLGYMPLKKI